MPIKLSDDELYFSLQADIQGLGAEKKDLEC